MNFLEFVKNKNTIINESSISTANIDKYIDLIKKLLNKHIDGLYILPGFTETNSDKDTYISKSFVVTSKKPAIMFQINWKKSSSNIEPYSIDFFNSLKLLFSGKDTSKLTLYTHNSSLVYFLPIIWTVINQNNFSLSNREAIKISKQVFKSRANESLFYVGALKYHIFEKRTEAEEFASSKLRDLIHASANVTNSPQDKERYEQLDREYREIKLAIAGGATTIEEIQVSVLKNKTKIVIPTKEETKLENNIKNETDDPKIAFQKIEGYVKMVTKGVNPSLIICGAPGVGKTYRVKKVLKEENYIEDKNLFTIKGKCTPRRLYLALYEYRKKGDIVVIDDADSLIGPKAPEDCINILKGALDSTSEPEGRLVSYGVGTKILDDDGNEVPKRFYYNGSVIIITNYNAGSLDTALRGRSYIQDINFSTEQVLEIIKEIMPNIKSDELSEESKLKAYKYMKELVQQKLEIEISIRTFSICATLFECMKDNTELAKEMIKEQLQLQADRIKNKY